MKSLLWTIFLSNLVVSCVAYSFGQYRGAKTAGAVCVAAVRENIAVLAEEMRQCRLERFSLQVEKDVRIKKEAGGKK